MTEVAACCFRVDEQRRVHRVDAPRPEELCVTDLEIAETLLLSGVSVWVRDEDRDGLYARMKGKR